MSTQKQYKEYLQVYLKTTTQVRETSAGSVDESVSRVSRQSNVIDFYTFCGAPFSQRAIVFQVWSEYIRSITDETEHSRLMKDWNDTREQRTKKFGALKETMETDQEEAGVPISVPGFGFSSRTLTTSESSQNVSVPGFSTKHNTWKFNLPLFKKHSHPPTSPSSSEGSSRSVVTPKKGKNIKIDTDRVLFPDLGSQLFSL
ncbi:hypothetical protein FBU30_008672, partial [Linnemannia zychae]